VQIYPELENSELAGLAEVEKRQVEIENIEPISSRLRQSQHLCKIDKTNLVRDCANKNLTVAKTAISNSTTNSGKSVKDGSLTTYTQAKDTKRRACDCCLFGSL